MKNTIKVVLGLLAVGFVSCDAEFENPVTDQGFYDSGSADVSKYVAVGNSLTAGYADGALYLTGQENSYPNIMATQFAFVGGGEFTQPLVNDNLGGLMLGGQQVFANRFVLSTTSGSPSPVRLNGTPTTTVEGSAAGPFNNMGVPGAKSFHLNAAGYGAANPWFGRFQSSASASVIGDAASLNPTFFTLWIGNNDILSFATSGGLGVDQTGNFDPSTYGSEDITDPNVFAGAYSAQVDALTAGGAKGVLINIPDVTSIPFFTTVPVNPIPLDAATAALVNGQFALYNTQVLPGLVSFNIITAEEAALRMVNFSAGLNNYPIITDEDLTDISAVLMGPPFNLPAQTAGLLGQLRQAKSDDLIVLTAAPVIGTTPDPSNPLGVIGVSIPLSDGLVLTSGEQALVSAASAAYNGAIQAIADAKDLGFVDARAKLAQVANGGIAYDGGNLTSQFVTGGAFSLDGVHPTPRGYAFTANLIIDEINRKYEASIPKVNIGNYNTVQVTDVPNP